MRVRRGSLSLVLALTLGGYVSPAQADPVRVTAGSVRAGFGFLTGPLIGEGLGLLGRDFEVQSSLEEAEAAFHLTNPPTLALGSLADFSGLFEVGNPSFLFARFGSAAGVLGSPLTMSFTAIPIALSCSGSGASTACTGRAPFTFDTTLTFTPAGGDPVRHHLIGAGTVAANVTLVESRPYGGVTFDFAPSPTPEPATLVLLGTGLGIVGAAVRKRRRDITAL